MILMCTVPNIRYFYNWCTGKNKKKNSSESEELRGNPLIEQLAAPFCHTI
jgi:hypothetical protein